MNDYLPTTWFSTVLAKDGKGNRQKKRSEKRRRKRSTKYFGGIWATDYDP
jgi:hypothetical protein